MIYTWNLTNFARRATGACMFSIAAAFCAAALLTLPTTAMGAASPLLQWNFNADTGTTANNTGTLGPAGALTITSPVVLGAAGTGPTGVAGDKAIDATANEFLNSSSGLVGSATGDITTASLTKLTITGWIKDTNSSNYVSAFGRPRILTIGPTGYDGAANTPGSLQLNVFNGSYNGNFYGGELQFKVNGAGGADDTGFGGSGVVSTKTNEDFTGVLPDGTGWTFFAVTYDSDPATLAAQKHNTVNMYIGDNVPAHTLPAAVLTAAYPLNHSSTTATPGPVQFASASAYLLNNANKDAAYVGLGDDFRLYSGVLSLGQLDAVRLGVPFRTLGDWDRDGSVTSADIPAMLSALTDLPKFAQLNTLSPTDMLQIGDLNNDGVVTNKDIQGELDLVISTGGGSLSAVPEPSTFALLVGGIFLAGTPVFPRKKTFLSFLVGKKTKYLHRL